MFQAIFLTAAAAVCPVQDAVLAEAAEAIESTYVLAEEGARIAADVRAWAEQGRYGAWCGEPDAFVDRLNRDLDAHDGHFHVERPSAGNGEPDWLRAWREGATAANAGVREVRVLEGNIGYLRLASFYPWDQAGPKLTAAFALLADTGGLVLDLRQNGGGDAQTADQMVRAVTDDAVQAVQRIERREGSREDTLPPRELPGYDRPLVVLVDRRSGSAAEFVAYSLQALGRTRVVGGRTGGVAHMLGEARPLAHGYRISVPEARPVNLRTGGNWEGRGVMPDVPGGDDPLFVARRLLMALTLVPDTAAAGGNAASAAEVRTADVTRFFQVLDAAAGVPTAEALQRGYLEPGTDALREFSASRVGDMERLSRAIREHPALFANARDCAADLPAIQERVLAALRRLDGLLPSAHFPPVTVVVGRGTTGGVTTPAGVVIGLEALCNADWMQADITDRFVHLIAHEYVHVQQPGAAVEVEAPTVLYQAWLEGTAEFVGELISGKVAYAHLQDWTRGRECEIERAFLADTNSTDLSPWLYSGPGDETWRGDLGYWVGYRIARAYYLAGDDRPRALVEMLSVTPASAHQLLAASGWQPACGAAG